MQNDQLQGKRHSLAHLLAKSVRELYPGAQNAIGPAIENGFYQDFDVPTTISEEDLPKIEAKMREVLKTWGKSSGKEVSVEEAKKEFSWNKYKTELIDDFAKNASTITFYTLGDFVDLCKGGHAEDATTIDPSAFKLTKVAGAYWRGDEKNKMLTRIYGIAFDTKAELDEHLKMMEEAEKRDHKKLGKELGLFTFSPLVGAGFPLFLPKGNVIFDQLSQFVREEKEKRGYSFVHIPHVAKAELYKKSGHLGKYDAMMPLMTDEEGTQFAMKAMNCPHHFEVYNAEPHSYRDLPYRIAETTTVYRNEKSGELSGLVRVKSLTQDDTHHVIRHDQIQSEIDMILELMDKVYSTFGFSDYHVQISIRDPKNSDKYFGGDELWTKAETILIEAVKKWGRPYNIEEGEAAFYGPKIDIMVKDAIGRGWQLTTVQMDFNQPENFDMSYVAEDGSKQRPAVLHVAILGSVERFMGVLIEHYAGLFPLWLAPVQAHIIPISDKHLEYAKQLEQTLKGSIPGLRTKIDDRSESMGKKIREATTHKVPYMLVIGDKEIEAGGAAVRHRDGTDLGIMKAEDLAAKLRQEIDGKK